MPRYSKRHYEDVVYILREYRLAAWGFASEASEVRAETAAYIAEDFARLFERDNPAFDREKFIKSAKHGKR